MGLNGKTNETHAKSIRRNSGVRSTTLSLSYASTIWRPFSETVDKKPLTSPDCLTFVCSRMSSISTADLWWLQYRFSPMPILPSFPMLSLNSSTRSSNRVGCHFCAYWKLPLYFYLSTLFMKVISSSRRAPSERKCTSSRRASSTSSWATAKWPLH